MSTTFIAVLCMSLLVVSEARMGARVRSMTDSTTTSMGKARYIDIITPADSGLSGGDRVYLGGSVTLENTGVHSVEAGTGIEITGTAQDVVVGIADGGVTEDHLDNDAVTTDKLADDSVTGDKIVDGTITNDKLANAAITFTAGTGISLSPASPATVQLGGSLTISGVATPAATIAYTICTTGASVVTSSAAINNQIWPNAATCASTVIGNNAFASHVTGIINGAGLVLPPASQGIWQISYRFTGRQVTLSYNNPTGSPASDTIASIAGNNGQDATVEGVYFIDVKSTFGARVYFIANGASGATPADAAFTLSRVRIFAVKLS